MFYFEADWIIHSTVHALSQFLQGRVFFLTNDIANPKPFSRAFRAGFSLRLLLWFIDAVTNQLSKYSDLSVEEHDQFVGKKSKLENEQLSTGMRNLIYNFYRDHFTNDEFPLCLDSVTAKKVLTWQGFQRKSYHVG